MLEGRTSRTVLVACRTRCRRVTVLLAAGRFDATVLGVGIRPRRRIILPGLGVEAGEQPTEVLGVAVVVVHDRRGVGVRDDVLTEVPLVGEHVVDQPTKQHDVGADTDRDVLVGVGRRPGEPRIDVDDPCTARARFNHPLEPDGVRLGHIAADEHYAVGVRHVLQ